MVSEFCMDGIEASKSGSLAECHHIDSAGRPTSREVGSGAANVGICLAAGFLPTG